MGFKEIKGVIYDLDGTVISTEKIHEAGWVYAGKKIGYRVNKEMINYQRGRPNNDGAKFLLGKKYKMLGKKFIELKQEYVFKNLHKAKINKGFLEAYKELSKNNIDVWICTSSPRDFVDNVFSIFKNLNVLSNKAVSSEDYSKGKPNAEPLLVTFRKMNLKPNQCIYIGDALSDYLSSKNAKCDFVHFCDRKDNCENFNNKNVRTMNNHLDILKFI